MARDDAPTAEDLAFNIARLGELGLEVQITELDVQTGKKGSKEERLARQADLYRAIARVAVEAPNCSNSHCGPERGRDGARPSRKTCIFRAGGTTSVSSVSRIASQ